MTLWEPSGAATELEVSAAIGAARARDDASSSTGARVIADAFLTGELAFAADVARRPARALRLARR